MQILVKKCEKSGQYVSSRTLLAMGFYVQPVFPSGPGWEHYMGGGARTGIVCPVRKRSFASTQQGTMTIIESPSK
jgi:hypothetical protein